MRSLFVMDPVDRIDIRGDSSWVLMLDSQARGWPVSWCTPSDLFVEEQRAMARYRGVSMHPEGSPHFRSTEQEIGSLDDFELVWMRKDPPFDMDYVFATYVLDLANTLVLNDPRSIKLANEKMFALQWPALCPKTLVSNRLDDIRRFAAGFDRIVLKPWDGNGGRGVVVTSATDRNLGVLSELLTDEGRTFCIAQEFLPAIAQGYKRILLIDGEARGWFLRVPGEQDHRGNMHVGASVVSCELDENDRAICEALRPRLKKMGLVFVGIDVIGDRLTEINVTSPTGLQEVRQLQGRALGPELLDAAMARRSS